MEVKAPEREPDERLLIEAALKVRGFTRKAGSSTWEPFASEWFQLRSE